MPRIMQVMPLEARQTLTSNNINATGNPWLSATGTQFRGYPLTPEVLAVPVNTAISTGMIINQQGSTIKFLILDIQSNTQLELTLARIDITATVSRLDESVRDTFGRPISNQQAVAIEIPIIVKQQWAYSVDQQPDATQVTGNTILLSNSKFEIKSKDILNLSSQESYRVERISTPLPGLQQLFATLL